MLGLAPIMMGLAARQGAWKTSPSTQIWCVFTTILLCPTPVNDIRTFFQFAELISRKSGWDATSLAGLAGGNLLRVMESAEKVALQMKKEGIKSNWQLWEGRDDLPVRAKSVGQRLQT